MNASETSHRTDSIQLTLNGKAIETEACTVTELLDTQGLNSEATGIAVAVNDTVVRRSDWPGRALQQNDRVEVITAMQGG